MSTGTMTSKGQITIPRDVREALGLTAGTRVSFTRNASGEVVVSRQSRPLSELAGVLRYDGPPVSLDEMNEAIAGGAADDTA